MKIYAPLYYRDFKCIADKCRHSCCVGWEIDVDAESVERYFSYTDGYGKTVAESIVDGECPHFSLLEGDRCPHLREDGLCRMILELGEDSLCHICKEHPRFYNDTVYGREAGLGIACEEACRIILSSDSYDEYEEIGECDAEEVCTDFDSLLERKKVYGILSDRGVGYEDRIKAIEEAWCVSPQSRSDEAWRKMIDSLEYMDDSDKKLFLGYCSKVEILPEHQEKRERILAYFIHRHCAEAYDPEEFKSALGLSLFLERLFAFVICQGKDAEDAARIISEEIEYSVENTDEIRAAFE